MKFKIFLPIMGLLFLLGALLPPSPVAHAQGTPLPPPTSIPQQGEPEKKHKEHDSGESVGHGAGISGIVFNYSTGAAQPGIVVEIEGEEQSFRAETITDDRGYYQFGGLGSGQAMLNVHVPAGSVSVTPNWPVMLKPSTDQVINLGFYVSNQPAMQGGASPIAVMVSGMLLNDHIELQVDNRLNETVKGGKLEVQLFSGVEASPAIQTTQGMVQFGVSHVQIDLNELVSGGQVKVQIPVKNFPAVTQADLASQSQSKVRVIFSYDNQPTPQLLNLIPHELVASMAKTTPTLAYISPTVAEPFPAPNGADSKLYNAPAATPIPTLAVAPKPIHSQATAEVQASVSSPPSGEGLEGGGRLTFAFDPSPTGVQPPSLIPETGYQLNSQVTPLSSPLNQGGKRWVKIAAMLLGVGLLLGGGWSLWRKR